LFLEILSALLFKPASAFNSSAVTPSNMVSFVIIAGVSLASAMSVTAHTYQAIFPQSHLSKQYSQEFNEAFSVLKHFGGNGPWSQGVGYGIERDTPESCTVDQVVMIHRHGERYPEPSEAVIMQAALEKVYGANITTFKGDLSFLDDWTSYIDDECILGQESFSGPYAGLLSTYTLGNEYRSRYGHLWNAANGTTPFWSSGYERVIESARHFAQGFFGYNYTNSAALNIIPESKTRGANSLTPDCDVDNSTTICDALLTLVPLGRFEVAAARFNAQNPGLNLNATDILGLMGL
jgi:acid phosphatase